MLLNTTCQVLGVIILQETILQQVTYTVCKGQRAKDIDDVGE